MVEHNYGILTSIDWNSKKWQDVPTQQDLVNASYDYVKKHGYTNTAINFGHEKFKSGLDGYYSGLLPQLWSKVPNSDKARYLKVVFLKSQDWRDRQHYIVGLYAFPIFEKCITPSPLASFTRDFEMNVKARPEDIHLLETYVRLGAHNISSFLPDGKEMGKQGYNYLTKVNVSNVLDEMTKLNPRDARLSGIKFRIIKAIV